MFETGEQSTGVARQSSGPSEKVENCQVGVFLGLCQRFGPDLAGPCLVPPTSWPEDAGRRQRTGIVPQAGFAPQPELTQVMLGRAVALGVPASWVAGDRVYGDARRLRRWLEGCQKAYVLAVSGKERVGLQGSGQRWVKSVLAGLDEGAWQRLSVASGGKGPRLYDWQCVRLMAPALAGWRHCLLVRRSLTAEQTLTACAVFAPSQTDLATLEH